MTATLQYVYLSSVHMGSTWTCEVNCGLNRKCNINVTEQRNTWLVKIYIRIHANIWKPKSANHRRRRPEGPISYNPARGLGSTVSSPSGVSGEAPADFYSGAFWASQKVSGQNDYDNFLSQNTNSFFPVTMQQWQTTSIIPWAAWHIAWSLIFSVLTSGGVSEGIHKLCFVCIQQCTIKSIILQLWS